jgi:hypothetical protein
MQVLQTFFWRISRVDFHRKNYSYFCSKINVQEIICSYDTPRLTTVTTNIIIRNYQELLQSTS